MTYRAGFDLRCVCARRRHASEQPPKAALSESQAGHLGFESLSHKKSQASEWMPVIFGGDGGIRTLDLTDANRTLSQLSYAPILNYIISS